jgi:L-aspartate oxidase
MQHKNVYDFIVVGSGIAGLHTALTLAPYGRVLIITKKQLNASSTSHAQGGIAAVIKEDDTLHAHINDTVTAGYNHNKKEAVDFLVKGGAPAISKLTQLGVRFDKYQNGDYITSFEAAHSYPRILHATDFTGREIEKALIANVLKKSTIEVWENTTAIDLIIKDNQCYGIQVLKDEKILNIFARAVILATGGAGQLYQWTTNPSVSTGDGIAIAWRAGAKVADLEFMQFHPTALKENASPLLLLSEALRGEGAILLNSKGERFMRSIHPRAELAPRDIVARAIFHQQQQGDVYLDISKKKKAFILKRFPNIAYALQKRGYDLTREPIPVTPAAHFMCGGIVTDIYGRTSIRNFFAYGETAATGVHGANRLASNSLLEGIVFSNQIQYCIDELPKFPQVISFSPASYTSHTFPTINSQIRTIMWQYAGIVRTRQGLATAGKKLRLLQYELDQIKGINASLLETTNMLIIGRLIIKAARNRHDSLGTHYMQ